MQLDARVASFRKLFIALACAQILALCAPADSEHDEERLVHIQHSIQSGDLRGARAEIEEALKAFPRDARLYNFLGVVDAQERNLDGAEVNFRRAIAEGPRLTGAYLNLGRLYQERSAESPHLLEKALDVYLKLLQMSPSEVEALYQTSWLLNRLKRFNESLQYLDRMPAGAQRRAAALSLRTANQSALGQLSQATASANQLIAAEDLAEADVVVIVPALTKPLATSLLETLVRRGLASPAALTQLATIYEESGHFKQAADTLAKVLPTGGQPPVALLNRLAKLAYQSGDLEGALDYLAHARDLEPGNAAIHYLIGLICIDLKLPPEATQSLQEAVRLDSENPYYNYALGAVLLQAKNADGAIPHLKKFHDARPDDPRGVFALGVAYFDAEQLDQARKEFESVVNQPETRVGANLYLGRLAMRDDKLDEAADHLQRAIQASPSAPEPYAELGLVEIRRHEYGLAEKALSQAVQLSPDSYRANLNLLMLYQRTKDARADGQAQRVEQLVKAGEERERLLLRSLEIHPY